MVIYFYWNMRLYVQNVVETLLVPNLLASEKLGAVCRIIEQLPNFSDTVLECHLGQNSRTDVSILLSKAIHELSASLQSYEAWQQSLELSQILSNVQHRYRKYIKEVWLEFDSEEHMLPLPVPCILVALKPNEPTEVLSEVAAWALKLRAKRINENLQALLMNTPANTVLLCVARMWSRNTDSLRVLVGNVSLFQVPELLQKNQWKGNLSELEFVLKQLSRYLETIVLSFDINKSIEPRIGLECYFERANKSNQTWCNFLDYLLVENLCTRPQAAALLEWPSIDYEGNLSYLRFVTHIKIVLNTGQPTRAKAYLGLQQQKA